jgi:hypothetical protein
VNPTSFPRDRVLQIGWQFMNILQSQITDQMTRHGNRTSPNWAARLERSAILTRVNSGSW